MIVYCLPLVPSQFARLFREPTKSTCIRFAPSLIAVPLLGRPRMLTASL